MCIKWCIKNGYPLYTNSDFFSFVFCFWSELSTSMHQGIIRNTYKQVEIFKEQNVSRDVLVSRESIIQIFPVTQFCKTDIVNVCMLLAVSNKCLCLHFGGNLGFMLFSLSPVVMFVSRLNFYRT